MARKVRQGYAVAFDVVNLERHNWLQAVATFAVVIWKPLRMGPRSYK